MNQSLCWWRGMVRSWMHLGDDKKRWQRFLNHWRNYRRIIKFQHRSAWAQCPSAERLESMQWVAIKFLMQSIWKHGFHCLFISVNYACPYMYHFAWEDQRKLDIQKLGWTISTLVIPRNSRRAPRGGSVDGHAAVFTGSNSRFWWPELIPGDGRVQCIHQLWSSILVRRTALLAKRE